MKLLNRNSFPGMIKVEMIQSVFELLSKTSMAKR